MVKNSNFDITMLELFLNELEIHTRTLEKGLLGIEKNPSPQFFESLMRAAHSIKGAARVIGLNQAVELAHTMEDIFENSQKTGVPISESKIQILLDSSDFYSSLLNYKAEEIPDILDKSIDKINNLLSKLKEKEDTNIPKSKEVKVEGNQESEALEKPINATKIYEFKDFRKTAKNIKVDNTLLDLFKNEIYTNSEAIIEVLSKANSNLNEKDIKSIGNSLNSIKGASKIVGIEEPSEIVDFVSKLLQDIENTAIDVKIEKLIPLFQILKDMPNSDDTEIIDYFTNIDFNTVCKSIFDDEKSEKPATETEKIDLKNEAQIEDLPKESNEQTEEKSLEKNTEIPQVVEKEHKEKKEERFVKVLSENLNKLLGLAGEITVQNKSLKPFSNEMQKVKLSLLELNSLREAIHQDIFQQGISEELSNKFEESAEQLDIILSMVINYIDSFENFSRRLEMTSDRLYKEVVSTRMKPFSEGLYGFSRLVRDVSKELGKKVELVIKGESTKVDRDILDKLEAPLNHLVRNSIDHGIEMPDERAKNSKDATGKITLEARHSSGMLLISITDDGRGIDIESLRKSIVKKGFAKEEMAKNYSNNELYDFLFLPGFSTRNDVTEISGRGVGLDVVFSMVNEVGGIIKVESQFGQGTTFNLQLPLTLSVIRTMLVEVNKEPYAIPLARIDRVLTMNYSEIKSVENLQYIEYNEENIGIVNAQQIFGLEAHNKSNDKYDIVILSDRLNKYGIVVDRLISQPDLVVMPLDKKLGKIPNISAGSILEDGTPVLIIDAEDVVRSIDRITKTESIQKVAEKGNEIAKKTLHILVVDDSLTVREVEKKLLENAGYTVTVAVDGIDGWNTIHQSKFDLVISDIDMPRMNGIEMVKRIKSDTRLREIPVMIVSYKDREEDRLQGLEAGANYYLTKSSFHDDTLLEAVEDLIGKP